VSHEIDYIFNPFPRWLEYSGLPALVNKELGAYSWPILKQLIELDCRYNRKEPGWYDVSQDEISDMLGISTKTVYRYLKALHKAGHIQYKPGKYKRSKGSVRIGKLRVRKVPEEIMAINGGSCGKTGKPYKYRYGYERWTESLPLRRAAEDYPSEESRTSSPESWTGSLDKENDKETDKETDTTNRSKLTLKNWDAVIKSKRLAHEPRL
jgi:hypothetical protein